jgi:PAS domain S-box-containing protein
MEFATSRNIKSIEAFALMLLVVFTTELSVMEIFHEVFIQLGVVMAALADATLLAVISALPLWIIFSPGLVGSSRRGEAARQVLLGTLFSLCGGFFLIELLTMLLLPLLLQGGGAVAFGLADAGVTTLLTAPLLWFLLARLERDRHRVVFVNLLESPLLLYLLLLYVVFLAALLHDLIVPEGLLPASHGPIHILGAALLTLIIAPFLWLFVARPLRRVLLSERVRARTVYEQVIDAVVVADAEGLITSLNPAALHTFGYAETELLGQPVARLFDASSRGPELLRTKGSSYGDGFREMPGWHRSGRTLLLEVSVSEVNIGGDQGFLMIMRDIGERREAERALRESDIRFREVFEQSEDALLFFKPASDYIIDANATAEKLFGCSKAEIRGRGLERLFHGRDLVRVQTAVCGLKADGLVKFDTLEGLRTSGSGCIVSMRIKFMTLQGVAVVYCVLRDITERVQMEQEARDIQARLIQANKMTSLGLLVSGVAHEVNNPNNLIMTNAQLLANGVADVERILHEYYRENGDFNLGGIPYSELDGQLPQLINGISDGSRRIDSIVTELKNYARRDPSGMETSIDFNQVVVTAINLLQHELSRSTARFRCELAGDLPAIIGNGQQLGQVVINLLINACQALPSRQQGIRLATVFDPVARQVVLTVTDEGVGISPEDGLRIMEPFFTTRLDRGGTGLGLSICRSIVAQHRGQLEFSSQPGNGATFTVKLPVENHEERI